MVNKKKSCGKLRIKESSLSLFSIDDYFNSVHSADMHNESSLNNESINGRYWSSTPNPNNNNNAYNLKFDEDECNVNNNNNRNNGYAVRPVAELTSKPEPKDKVCHFSISKEQLLNDLYIAYKDARKHKRSRSYQLKYEFNLENNLVKLRDELINRTYKPMQSTCFVIHEPKMREVFAANFRDRIVHHLFYNYTHEHFEKTFIYDSYSCIKNRGTHFGIERLKHHILSVSEGYSKPCYVLKIDIKGYFMNINRDVLLKICRKSLSKFKNKTIHDSIFIDYLLETIINTNPMENCMMIGSVKDWDNLPEDKSLFFTKRNCGLPIGNLSSQLFSNIYMNQFDQYVKRVLKCRHYGRYVDDAYIVSEDKKYLKKLIDEISLFLLNDLGLEINMRKTKIHNAYNGIEFLGAFIKPFRTYVSSSTLRRIERKLKNVKKQDAKKMRSSINSWLGVLSHYDSYYIRKTVFRKENGHVEYGNFDRHWLKYKF